MLNAQISKGNWMVGSSFFYGNVNGGKSETSYSNTPTVYNSDSNSINFGIAPYMGYFIKDKLAVGGQIGASFYHSKSTSTNTSSTTTVESTYDSPSFFIGPFVRYYFIKDQKWTPYVHAEFNYGIQPTKSESVSSTGSSSTTKSNSSSYWDSGARFGMAYFLNSHVALQIYTGLSFSSNNADYDYTPSSGSGYSYSNKNDRWYVPVGVSLQIHLDGKSSKSE